MTLAWDAMTDRPESHQPAPGSNKPAVGPSAAGSESINAGKKTPNRELTAEEQMDLYEKDLKETDWGHQPC